MSDTPRTDAEAQDDFMVNHDASPPEVYVSSEFARKLERELSESLEHQGAPFHTCGGKDCLNKYCQMRQRVERLVLAADSLVNLVAGREQGNDDTDKEINAVYEALKPFHTKKEVE